MTRTLALLAQAAPAVSAAVTEGIPAGVVPGVVGNGVGLSAFVAVLWWLIKYYGDRDTKKDERYQAELDKRDKWLVAQVDRLEAAAAAAREEQREFTTEMRDQLSALVQELRHELKDQRAEGLRMGVEVTKSLEHVQRSIETMARRLEDVEKRVAAEGRAAEVRSPTPRKQGGQ